MIWKKTDSKNLFLVGKYEVLVERSVISGMYSALSSDGGYVQADTRAGMESHIRTFRKYHETQMKSRKENRT